MDREGADIFHKIRIHARIQRFASMKTARLQFAFHGRQAPTTAFLVGGAVMGGFAHLSRLGEGIAGGDFLGRVKDAVGIAALRVGVFRQLLFQHIDSARELFRTNHPALTFNDWHENYSAARRLAAGMSSSVAALL